MLPTLPFEIITLILTMLPTETLVRFQCVCKAWRDLIRDPMFIKQHSRTRESKGNGYLLYVSMNYDPCRAFTLLCEETFEEALEIDVPFQPVDMYLIVVGSCNGLLCVSDTDSDESDDYLGWSFKNQETVECTKVEVYSTITKSWKNVEVEGFLWSVYDINSELVVCDTLHWKAFNRYTNKDALVIVAFHLGNETFQQITLPNYEVDGEDMMEYVTLYKGHLSLFLFKNVDDHPHPWQDQCCYLWVMKEYGVYSSWTKTLTITVAPGVVRPLGFTRNDEIVFEDYEQDLVVSFPY
ncbi:UNVERIFIED_CONTAM: F-box protein [Sesamum calycinum]|uniref:F-box protein n=1 Tax=Sesamum calycinum TaxID=2727403 RepID=A0AAW2R6Z3_9LAMI